MTAAQAKTRKAERTRAQILAAAAERFASSGYRETRLEDVGQDVGIGRSAVLYHFRDKQQLYRAVLDEIFGGLLALMRSSLVASGSLAERIEIAVDAFIEFMWRHPAAARIAARESVVTDPVVRGEVQSQARPFLTLLEMIFEEGERAGEFRPRHSDPFQLVSIIAGSTVFYIAALPTFIAELPFDHLSQDQLRAYKRDMLDVTRRLLGIRGPRLVSDGS